MRFAPGLDATASYQRLIAALSAGMGMSKARVAKSTVTRAVMSAAEKLRAREGEARFRQPRFHVCVKVRDPELAALDQRRDLCVVMRARDRAAREPRRGVCARLPSRRRSPRARRARSHHRHQRLLLRRRAEQRRSG